MSIVTGIAKKVILKGQSLGIAPSVAHSTEEILKLMQRAKPIEKTIAAATESQELTMRMLDYNAGLMVNRISEVFQHDEKLLDAASFAREARRPERFTKLFNDEQKKTFAEIDDMFAKFGQEGFKQGVFKELLPHYVTHIYQGKDQSILKKLESALAARMGAETPYSLHRVIETTLEEAKNLGLSPRVTRIDHIVGAYTRSLVRAVGNRRLIDDLKAVPMLEGFPAFGRSSAVPSDYVKFMNKDMTRALGFPEDVEIGVHPDIARELKTLFRSKDPGKWMNAFLITNQWMKHTKLTASLFHPQSLIESSMAFFGPIKGAKVRDAEKGLVMLQQGTENARFAIASGVNMVAPDDVPEGLLSRGLDRVADLMDEKGAFAKILTTPTRGLSKGIKLYDRGLWGYYYSGIKMFAFDRVFTEELAKLAKKMKPGEIIDEAARQAIGKDVARVINNSFGGINWGELGVSRDARDWMQGIFLAADWTVANILNFTKAMNRETIAKLYPGIESSKLANAFGRPGVELDRSRMFALRAAANFGIILVGANYALSKHGPWANARGHELDIELPYTDDNGRRKYVRSAKQFREPFHWLSSPISTFYGKMGLLPRVIGNQLSGRDFFGRPIVKADDLPHAAIAKRVLNVGRSVAPIPVDQALSVVLEGRDPASAAITAAGFPVVSEYSPRGKPKSQTQKLLER